jgi:hypothetical protein
MANYASSPVVEDTWFLGNQAIEFSGGGIYNFAAAPRLTNCVFQGNNGFYYGGAFYNIHSTPVLTHCTLSGNRAEQGAGMSNNDSPVILKNSIVWGNIDRHTPDARTEIDNVDSVPTFRHCIVGTSGGSGAAWRVGLGTDGGGNLDADPRFLNAASALGPDGTMATADDGFRPGPDSPALDAADPQASTAQDVLRTARPQGAAPDVGAYERPFPDTVPADGWAAAAVLGSIAAWTLLRTARQRYAGPAASASCGARVSVRSMVRPS